MTAKNEITGDSIISKASTQNFNKGYDNIDWSLPLKEDNNGRQSGTNGVSSRLLESPVGLDGTDK